MKETYRKVMVLVSIDDADRTDVEGFEGSKFEDYSQFLNTSNILTQG